MRKINFPNDFTSKRLIPGLIRCEDSPLPTNYSADAYITLSASQYAEFERLSAKEQTAHSQIVAIDEQIHHRLAPVVENGRTYTPGIIFYEDDEYQQLQEAEAEYREAGAKIDQLLNSCQASHTAAQQERYPVPTNAQEPHEAPPAILQPAEAPASPEQIDLEAVRRFVKNGRFDIPPKPVDVAKIFLSKIPVRSHGERLYFFNGTHYESPDELKIKQKIVAVCRTDYEQSGSPRIAEQVYDALLLEPEIVMPDDALYNTRYLAFENCVVDLHTQQLLKHSYELPIFYKLRCNYLTSGADCPRFKSILSLMTGSDPVLQERIWEAIGYSLTPDTNAKAMFLLQGIPHSGKSQLIEILCSFFDRDVVHSISINEFADRFSRSEFLGKRICSIPDMPFGRLDAKTISLLKQYSGNDYLSTDVKYRGRVKFFNQARFWMATNHLFCVAGDDVAFLDRIVTIPFKFAPPREARINNLAEYVACERDAIASIALQKYFALRARGYKFSGDFELNEVVAESAAAEEDIDAMMDDFVDNYIVADEAPGCYTFIQTFFDAFVNLHPHMAGMKSIWLIACV